MVVDSDSKGPRWTLDNDKRITMIGKFLRRTALDELPGLISIWNGDMSFVGPRALDISEQNLIEQRIPGFALRLQVVPGLTGLAQVFDNMDVAEDKLRYDLEYINKMNLRLDLLLILLSVKNSFLAKWDNRHGKDQVVEDRID